MAKRSSKLGRRSGQLLEALESRRLLSTIDWTNRFTSSGPDDNRFDEVFGTGNERLQAIQVVDAAIAVWERIIDNFNYPGGGNTFNLKLSMNPTPQPGPGIGANASMSIVNGKAVSGTIELGWINQPMNGNNLRGWYCDPSAYESTEFGAPINGFAAPPGSGVSGMDLFTTVVHELGHCMGLCQNVITQPFATNTGVVDNINTPASTPASNYWRFDSTDVHALFTAWDSGGAGGGASNMNGTQHFAPQGAQVNQAGRWYFGAPALMNAVNNNRNRYLPSDVDALLLEDAFGYTITRPSTLPNMYNRLLADGTLKIYGSSSNDTFTIDKPNASTIRVTMQLGAYSAAVDGNGSFTATYPVSFVDYVVVDAFDGNDTLVFGSGDLASLPDLTFHGGNGSDTVRIENRDTPNAWKYSWRYGSFDATNLSTSAARSYWLNGVETTILNSGNGADTLQIYGSDPGSYIGFFGGGGDDKLMLGSSNPADNSSYANCLGPVNFMGEDGLDSIIADDRNYQGGQRTYNLTTSTVFGNITYGAESLTVIGPNNHASTFNVSGSGGASSLTLKAGAGNDAFNFTNTTLTNVSIDGGGGFNWLSIDDRTHAGSLIDQPNIYADRITRGYQPQLNLGYDNFQSVVYYLPAGQNSVDVFGISSDISNSASFQIRGNTSNDEFNIFPRDAAGLTINGLVDFWGGGGQNKVAVWDAGNDGATYTITSPNPSLTMLSGVGAGRVQVEGDVQELKVRGASGNDAFHVNEVRSGIALALYGGSGDDSCTLGNGDMSANLTNCAAFTFDGQTGSDRFTIANGATNVPWTYRVQSTFIECSKTGGGYFWHSDLANIESQYVSSGSSTDFFLVDAVAPGVYTELLGTNSIKALVMQNSDRDLRSISGEVAFHPGPGGGYMIVDNRNDNTADTVHLTATTLGAYAGDNLFGAGGSLVFSNIVNNGANPGIQVTLSTGANTVYAQPLASTQVSISSHTIFTAPSGSIKLALAGVSNPVINGDAGSGSLTSSNRQPLFWNRFVGAIDTDAVAPAMIAGNINLNGIPGPGDSGARRQAVSVQFSENVSGLLNPSWLQLTNTTTNQPVPTSNIAVEYDLATNTAHFTFPGYPLGILPDGDYTGKILAGLPDSFGNGLPADAPFSFFFVQADANHDRRVSLQDFNILAGNFGQSNRTFSQGDFNYDGQVSLADFNILAGRFGTALSSAAASSVFGDDRIDDAERADDPVSELIA